MDKSRLFKRLYSYLKPEMLKLCVETVGFAYSDGRITVIQ